MNSLFCRHNRFTADCPICSKGTVLGEAPTGSGRRKGGERSSATGARAAKAPPAQFVGPYAAAGPYEDPGGTAYEVRLERVPGGLRLAEWAEGKIRRRAPELAARDLPALIETARERGALRESDAAALGKALAAGPAGAVGGGAAGVSPARAGDMREELRVEALAEHGMVRIARWILRPGSDWELQAAPPMLPASRYAEAIRDAAARGLLAGASDRPAAARP